MNWLQEQPVVLQAFLAGLFTQGCTIVGSAVVFFFKTVSRKLLDIMMGFAAGVMIAASFWSLLQPSIEYAKGNYGVWSWMPAALGFLLGGFFLRFIDAVVPHLHLSKKDVSEAESLPEHSRNKLSKTALLFLAITIHNFWQQEQPLVPYPAIPVRKFLSELQVWLWELVSKMCRKGQPCPFLYGQMGNRVLRLFTGARCRLLLSLSERFLALMRLWQ